VALQNATRGGVVSLRVYRPGLELLAAGLEGGELVLPERGFEPLHEALHAFFVHRARLAEDVVWATPQKESHQSFEILPTAAAALSQFFAHRL
jgi:hypothetical protein